MASTCESKPRCLPSGAEGSWEAVGIEVAIGECELVYRLRLDRGSGTGGGAGWVEETRGGAGDGATRRVSATEAFAVARCSGAEEEIEAATEELIAHLPGLEGRGVGAGAAARLREELAQGRALARVAAEPLRRRLLQAIEEETTLSRVAREVGLAGPRGKGDVTALLRRLGLEPHSQRSGRRTWSQTVAYEEAVAIARAVGADPFEVGV